MTVVASGGSSTQHRSVNVEYEPSSDWMWPKRVVRVSQVDGRETRKANIAIADVRVGDDDRFLAQVCRSRARLKY